MIKKGTILVVDDSATNLMLLASILSADGYDVRPVESGELALAEISTRPPDLVLLDIRMAGLNGFDVCRRLKAGAQTRDIPIMFISGASDTAERIEGLELGAVDFISKPVQRGELRARVKTHLELARLRSETERYAGAVERSNQRLQQELSQRSRAEQALASSLREKEGLLKEAHHRVKNNLALIVSLMRIESERSRETETQSILAQMQSRIQSVILLNEVLYKTESYSTVALDAYLRQIATHLFQAQNDNSGAVRLRLDLSPLEVPTRAAIPCGLIVNELMTNSLKHAFPGGRSGEIRIALKRQDTDTVRLQVSDNGPGLPAGFRSRVRDSLGLSLVTDLARQIRGSLEFGAGAIFVVTFPSPIG